ncbi:MAG TPA: hypothetical protein VKE96_24235 [Vicinamibacterales bacterium]|nr:hypothetical protein [Vicinamibacterales bacterium]
MSIAAVMDEPRLEISEAVGVQPRHTFRLRPIMRQGTASSIPQAWERFDAITDARAAAKSMYHDDRVLRVFIVIDECPPQFVEWVDR